MAKWLARIALSLTLSFGTVAGVTPASALATDPQHVHTGPVQTSPVQTGPVQTWTVGDKPESLVVSPDGNTLYVANSGSNEISVIETTTGVTTRRIAIPNGLFDIALSPDGSRLFATRYDIGDLTVVKTDSNTIERHIAVGGNPTFVVASPDGRTLFVSHATSDTIAVVDLPTAQVASTIQLSDQPTNLAVSADGKRLYVSSDSSFVTVVDLVSKTQIAKIDLGCPPFTIAIDDARKTVFVACGLASKVAVIDATTNKAVAPIAVRGKPYGFALDSKADVGFVTDVFANKVSVIDLETKAVIAHFDVGAPSTLVKANTTDGRVYVLLGQDNQVEVLSFPRASAIASQTVKEGRSVTFSSKVINNPTSMRWEVSANSGKNFKTIAGATSSSFRFKPSAENSGNLYRLVLVDDLYGKFVTAPAKLTVLASSGPKPVASGPGLPADPLFVSVVAFAVLLLGNIAFLIVFFVRRPKTPST